MLKGNVLHGICTRVGLLLVISLVRADHRKSKYLVLHLSTAKLCVVTDITLVGLKGHLRR